MPTNDEIKKMAAELDRRLKHKRASTQNTSAAAGTDEDWKTRFAKESNEALARQAAKKQTDDKIKEDTDAIAEIKRLAALTQLQYERERKAAAEKLDMRASVLEQLVKAERAKNTPGDDGKPGHAVEFPEPEPWADPVQGAELLDEIVKGIRRHIVMPDHSSSDICALWAVHTYLLDQFLITPRLAISSPMKGCGKTTLLDVFEHLVLKPLKTCSVTSSVTFRVIEAKRPTLLIDEAKHIGDKTDLLEVLNDGHRRGGQTLRNVAVGDDYEPRAFSTYAAVAISLIGALPPELHDRSVLIKMKRRLPGERIEELRVGRTGHLHVLARKIARWVKDHTAGIADAEPAMPSGIYNREADNWRPLLAIADAADEEWGKRARDAAIKCHAAADADDHSWLEQLLSDIRDIGKGGAEMPSADLVGALIKIEGRPWADGLGKNRDKPLTQNKLARMLKPLSIIPENIWISENKVLKGYVFAHFEDAFTRYLPPEGGFKPLGRYDADEMGTSSGFQTARSESDLAVAKCKKPNNDGHPSALAVAKGGDSKKPAIDAQKTPSADPNDTPSTQRICAQCKADGEPPQKLRDIWLHPECRPFWLKDHPAPGNKTNGKPAKTWLVSALEPADHETLAYWQIGLMLEDDWHEVRAHARLREVLIEMVSPETVEREFNLVMQAFNHLLNDSDQPQAAIENPNKTP
jgi:putative DNA primase/helicase